MVRCARSKRCGLPSASSLSVRMIRLPCVVTVPIDLPGVFLSCAIAELVAAIAQRSVRLPSSRSAEPNRNTFIRFANIWLSVLLIRSFLRLTDIDVVEICGYIKVIAVERSLDRLPTRRDRRDDLPVVLV